MANTLLFLAYGLIAGNLFEPDENLADRVLQNPQNYGPFIGCTSDGWLVMQNIETNLLLDPKTLQKSICGEKP